MIRISMKVTREGTAMEQQKILVVDDDKEILFSMSKLLERQCLCLHNRSESFCKRCEIFHGAYQNFCKDVCR